MGAPSAGAPRTQLQLPTSADPGRGPHHSTSQPQRPEPASDVWQQRQLPVPTSAPGSRSCLPASLSRRLPSVFTSDKCFELLQRPCRPHHYRRRRTTSQPFTFSFTFRERICLAKAFGSKSAPGQLPELLLVDDEGAFPIFSYNAHLVNLTSRLSFMLGSIRTSWTGPRRRRGGGGTCLLRCVGAAPGGSGGLCAFLGALGPGVSGLCGAVVPGATDAGYNDASAVVLRAGRWPVLDLLVCL